MNSSLSKSTEAQMLEHIRLIKDSYPFYREKHLKIKTKEATLIPFSPNKAQLLFEKAVEKQRAAGRPIRIIVLKARQEGISTDISGIFFHNTVTRQYRSTQVISHDPKTTQSLFEIYKTFYDNLPTEIKPMQRYNNKTALVFENPDQEARQTNPGLGSAIYVATSNKVKGGRGITLHNLHCSEIAFWQNASDLMLSIKQAVGDNSDTAIFLESTANGTEGYFPEQYWAAKRGETDYVAIFLPFFIHDEYEKDGFIENLNEYERDFLLPLIRGHGYSDEQAMRKIVWRRWAIQNKCDGDVRKFMQEYPATDIEAFQKKEGLVYPEFNEAVHVIPHFDPDPNEYVFIGGYDFGAVHPTGYVGLGIDRHGNVYQFAERKMVGLSFEKQAEEIHAAEGKLNVTRRYRGHDSGAVQAEEELKRYKITLDEGLVSREVGISLIRGLLQSGKYFVSDRCVNTIYEFKNHVHKNKNEIKVEAGVVKTDGEAVKDADVEKKDDDCLDALRYALASHFKRPKPMYENKVEKLAKVIQRELKLKKKGGRPTW